MNKKGKIILTTSILIFCSLLSFNTYAKVDNKNVSTSGSVPTTKELVIEYQKYANTNQNKNENKGEVTKKENSDFVYIKEIGMPEKHQKYLYNMCKKRNLDYFKVLAIIKHESGFNSQQVSSTNDYGYMQINKVNHKSLAQLLKTENKPLDPYVNMNWGTYMLSDLYKYWEKKGASKEIEKGESFSQLDKYVMSSYNKGINGFKKNGMANKYIGATRGAYRDLKKLR